MGEVDTLMIYFTADTHFGHARIIQYCRRPFSSHEEMDEVMIERFNEVLRPGDLLYHLGDVSFSTFRPEQFTQRLKTKEIHLILGNHDQLSNAEYLRRGFKSVREVHHLTIDKIRVDLFHYAQRTWLGKGRGGFHLFGHSHGTLPGLDRSMDVGVDTNDFRPYSWAEIRTRLINLPVFSDSTRVEFETGLGAAHERPVPAVGSVTLEGV